MTAPQSLAYIVAESSDLSKWQHYGEQMLGMQAHISADGLHLKMDERAHRIAVIKGDHDRYVASGWEMGSDADFDAAVSALNTAGVATTEADGSARGFTRMVRFSDPAGNAHELVAGYVGKTAPFQSPIGVEGFKTGIYGMGHTVLPAPADFDATLKLFRDVLGMGLSDVFNFQPGPDAPVMRIYFLHGASGRHHSLALAEMPNPAGCVHVMVEVDKITDVGKAHDRRVQLDIKMMATLGEHENDRMTSFYMLTPSNFALEYGWGGIEVDPATWETTHTKQVSIWGHDFSVGFQ